MPSRYRRIDLGNHHADRTLRRLGEEVRIARLSAGWSLRELARQDGRCYFRPESMALIDATPEQDEEVAPALLMAS